MSNPTWFWVDGPISGRNHHTRGVDGIDIRTTCRFPTFAAAVVVTERCLLLRLLSCHGSSWAVPEVQDAAVDVWPMQPTPKPRICCHQVTRRHRVCCKRQSAAIHPHATSRRRAREAVAAASSCCSDERNSDANSVGFQVGVGILLGF